MEKVNSDLQVSGNLEVQQNLQLNGSSYMYGALEIQNALNVNGTLHVSPQKRVGIGNDNPQTKLQIDHDGASTYGVGMLLNQYQVGNADGPKIQFRKTLAQGAKNWVIGIDHGSDNRNFVISENGGFDATSNWGTKRFVIAENGFVGIGTDRPEQELTIVRNDNGNADVRIQNNSGLALDVFSGTTRSGVWSYGRRSLELGTDGKVRLKIMDNGNVGIGIPNPGARLAVNGMVHSTSGGFRFPDGSVQSKASYANVIRSGAVRMNTTGNWKTSPLVRGNSYITPYINLTGFTRTPHIMYSIYVIDAKKDANLRFNISIRDVSSSRFRIQFQKWADTEIYDCNVRWFAIGQ